GRLGGAAGAERADQGGTRPRVRLRGADHRRHGHGGEQGGGVGLPAGETAGLEAGVGHDVGAGGRAGAERDRVAAAERDRGAVQVIAPLTVRLLAAPLGVVLLMTTPSTPPRDRPLTDRVSPVVVVPLVKRAPAPRVRLNGPLTVRLLPLNRAAAMVLLPVSVSL